MSAGALPLRAALVVTLALPWLASCAGQQVQREARLAEARQSLALRRAEVELVASELTQQQRELRRWASCLQEEVLLLCAHRATPLGPDEHDPAWRLAHERMRATAALQQLLAQPAQGPPPPDAAPCAEPQGEGPEAPPVALQDPEAWQRHLARIAYQLGPLRRAEAEALAAWAQESHARLGRVRQLRPRMPTQRARQAQQRAAEREVSAAWGTLHQDAAVLQEAVHAYADALREAERTRRDVAPRLARHIATEGIERHSPLCDP